MTLGSDLSGTVVALGDGVADLAIGDPVFGVTNKRFTNAYAELALASAVMIAKRPAVSQPDQVQAARRGVRASFILVDVNREALTRIGGLLAARKIEGRLGPTLPLSEARRAHEMLDGLVPRRPGKIFLAIG